MEALFLLGLELLNSPAFIASFLVDAVGGIVVSGWSLIGWGAYRQINNLSKWKSAVAYLITLLLGLLVGVVSSLINNALMK